MREPNEVIIDQLGPRIPWQEVSARVGPRVERIRSALRAQDLLSVLDDLVTLVEPAAPRKQTIWVWTPKTIRRYSMLAEPGQEPNASTVEALRYLIREAGATLVIHSISSARTLQGHECVMAVESPEGRAAVRSLIQNRAVQHQPAWMESAQPLPEHPRWFDTEAARLDARSLPLANAVLVDYAGHVEAGYQQQHGHGVLMPTPKKLM